MAQGSSGIDAQTLENRAIEITDNAIGDAPMLPELLAQIPPEEPLHSVSADGAYDTKACHEAIAGRQAAAITPTRRYAKPWADAKAGAQARNEILRAIRKLGRAIWKTWSGYHHRSLVETKMGCFQRLGERVMARDFYRQVTELQVHAPSSTGLLAWERLRMCAWHICVRGRRLILAQGYATAPICVSLRQKKP